MACLVLPVALLRSKCMGSRHGYRPLADEDVTAPFCSRGNPVTVLVGKERKEFLVDPFVLQETPFQVLIGETVKKTNKRDRPDRRRAGGEEAVFVDVDAILFEHMLWLMYNDCSSLFKLNVEEIIDFYAHDF